MAHVFEPKTPYLATSAIIEIYQNQQFQGVVLIDRKFPPLGKALPGGMVDYGETAEDAVRREMIEEVNLELHDLKQFHLYSDPKRDTRFHCVDMIFTAKSYTMPQAGDDAALAFVVPINQIPWNEMTLGHDQVLHDYLYQLN